jgi:hypothetical protein
MSASEGTFKREQSTMREAILELLVCLVIGILCVAVVVWDIVSGRIVYLDGIALAIIVLTLGVFFLFNVVWSYRTGELKQILGELRKRDSGGPGTAGANPK